LNLYYYDYYDPDWHRYEPRQEDVLTDLQAEERALRNSRGLQRLWLPAPWPIQVLPPFIFRLSLPLAALALAFGTFASFMPDPLAPRAPSRRLVADITLPGNPSISVNRTTLSLATSGFASAYVTNTSTDPLLVALRIEGAPPAELLAISASEPTIIQPGGSVDVWLRSDPIVRQSGGNFRFRVVIAAGPVPR
jgi:hypothetical protein